MNKSNENKVKTDKPTQMKHINSKLNLSHRDITRPGLGGLIGSSPPNDIAAHPNWDENRFFALLFWI